MKHIVALVFVVLGVSLSVAGCFLGDEIERTVDCEKICARYSDCITNIDVTACTGECEDQADANADYERRANGCEACLEDRSCEEAKPCWNTCPVESQAQ